MHCTSSRSTSHCLIMSTRPCFQSGSNAQTLLTRTFPCFTQVISWIFSLAVVNASTRAHSASRVSEFVLFLHSTCTRHHRTSNVERSSVLVSSPRLVRRWRLHSTDAFRTVAIAGSAETQRRSTMWRRSESSHTSTNATAISSRRMPSTSAIT